MIERKTYLRQLIRDSYPKTLLTMDFDNTNIDGVKKINVVDWLLKGSID